MTHDELLAKLDGSTKSGWWLALRAVVELHKPHLSCTDGCGAVGWCEACMEPPYPCPTIKAIEGELK